MLLPAQVLPAAFSPIVPKHNTRMKHRQAHKGGEHHCTVQNQELRLVPIAIEASTRVGDAIGCADEECEF
jgi:hypothetical protein